MKKLITIFSIVAVMAVNTHAAVTIDFTEVYVGPSTQENLTDQFAAYGITFEEVYRYIDSRDPWPENYGISNGVWEDNNIAVTVGTVNFTIPVTYVTLDWWDITSNQIHIDAYDSSDNLVDDFDGPTTATDDYGTITLSGASPIAYLTFHNDGGFTQIANMEFAPIPAPGAVLLGSISVGLVGWLRRRKIL